MTLRFAPSRRIRPLRKKYAMTLAASVATSLGMTMAAHAQSNVQIYGILDYGIQYTNNNAGGRLIGGTSGVKQGSRWGFRGDEDLGNGLKAVFRLENGLNLGNGTAGQGGLEFGRTAYVGLSSAQYGTITLGRQYDSVVDSVGALITSMKTGGGNTAHMGDLDNFNNVKRVNNAIKYQSQTYYGLSGNALYGMGNQAGDFTRNQIWSVGANYKQGPIELGAAYLNVRDPNQSFFTNTPTNVNGATTNNMTAYPVYSGYASAHTYQDIGAVVNYTIGKLIIGVNYSNVQFQGLGDSSAGANPLHLHGTATFNTGEINLDYMLRPDIVIGAVYSLTHGSGVGTVGSSNYHTLSLSYDYFLSKRTDVYLLASYQIANGTDSTGQSAKANIAALSASSSNRQAFLEAGLRVKF
ncbi:porin [Robbsia andropogonis]|uniref:porin n=1 Tax=Robbsia andropogonis TaxID=28092 RepID=UPI002A698BCA|nr:porin [Robbsia andropogonis]